METFTGVECGIGLVQCNLISRSLIDLQKAGQDVAIKTGPEIEQDKMYSIGQGLDARWTKGQKIAASARIRWSITCRRSLVRKCGG